MTRAGQVLARSCMSCVHTCVSCDSIIFVERKLTYYGYALVLVCEGSCIKREEGEFWNLVQVVKKIATQ